MPASLRLILTAIAGLVGIAAPASFARSDEDSRIGQFISLPSQISDDQVGLVRNRMLDLARRADREKREAVLVLTISPGTSTVGNVSDLARVLTLDDTDSVRTVAWLRSRVTGTHAVIALACHDIMMSPNAAIGDIGRGEPVPEDEVQFVRRLMNQRRNPRLSLAVAEAMMDPAVTLNRIEISGDGVSEFRFVTPDELQELVKSGTQILATERVKERGHAAVFSTEDAERIGLINGAAVSSDDDVRHAWDLPIAALRSTDTSESSVKAQVIAVHGPITPVISDFVVREIRKALAEGANLLIFDIDSPGGLLTSSEEIATEISDLDPAKVTTVAWVEHDAISGAAVVALGCDQIVMTADARIGDVGVIAQGADGAFDRVPEKLVSPFLLTLESLAKKKDRPVGLLQAMVDRNLHVFEVTHRDSGAHTFMTQFEIDAAAGEWIKGDIVPESRDEILLTVNGNRAHELQLAEPPCNDFNELRLRLGVPDSHDLDPRSATWVDDFVFILRSGIGGFALVSLALICLYLEAHLPGGFFGICSAVFISLFFWSRYLGGTAGTLELVMFALGVGLLLLEIFVIPGFGVFGISGFLLMTGALVMASHTFAGMSAGERFQESMGSLGTLTGALVTVIVVAALINQFLPSIPFLRGLILAPPGQISDDDGPRLASNLLNETGGGPVEVGARGIATSTLRPSGKAAFGDQYLDVVSEGAYIDHGSPVEVIRVAGNRIVVRASNEASG